ncbi:ribokinase [Microbacterium sp. W4I4]|uniref:carbohydrate kinase family protein n=1 Tax=Microbacterium sp. W4I4 TaxID=3042295 RepID=UPI002780CC66|nr:carbohydrate kinase family protein [Microbacterium sp. W4I4]MDQ0615638.1 ribokinase [Microbacterium sp. W4I4]
MEVGDVEQGSEDRRFEVLLLGDLNIDLHLDIPAYPEPGGDGVASRQRMGFGGSAANTAVMLARLGVRAAMLACVGDDEWGAQAIHGLTAVGVDTRLVQRSSTEPTSLNVITVTPDGERTMFAYRGASAELKSADVPPDLCGASHVHISGYALLADPQRAAAEAAAASAHRAGRTVSLDVPVDPVAAVPDVLRAFLANVDVVAIGTKEARQLTGEATDEQAAAAIAGYGPSTVALTSGASGSLLLTVDGFVRAPVPEVRAIDTTGAGDSFSAGLIFGFLRGFEEPSWTAAMANACGAAAVGVPGAGAGLPSLDGILTAVAALPAGLRHELMSAVRAEGGAA